MKKIFTILLLFSLSGLRAYTVESIKKEYPRIFTAKVSEYNGNRYITTAINKLPATDFLAGFIKSLYIDYILTNCSTFDRKKLNALTSDTVELNNFFHNVLVADSTFNNYFLEAVHYYLKGIGEDITDHKVQQKLQLSSDSLVQISTRFFFASRLMNEEPQWNICVGKNGYYFDKKTNMIPLVEAFCFNTIMTDLTMEEYNIIDDFKKNIRKLKEKKNG